MYKRQNEHCAGVAAVINEMGEELAVKVLAEYDAMDAKTLYETAKAT